MHHHVALALSHTISHFGSRKSNLKISIFATLITLVTTDLGGIVTSFMHHIVALALSFTLVETSTTVELLLHRKLQKS